MRVDHVQCTCPERVLSGCSPHQWPFDGKECLQEAQGVADAKPLDTVLEQLKGIGMWTQVGCSLVQCKLWREQRKQFLATLTNPGTPPISVARGRKHRNKGFFGEMPTLDTEGNKPGSGISA